MAIQNLDYLLNLKDRIDGLRLTLGTAYLDYMNVFHTQEKPLAFLLGPEEFKLYMMFEASYLEPLGIFELGFYGIPVFQKDTQGVEVRLNRYAVGQVYAEYLKTNPPLPGVRGRVIFNARRDITYGASPNGSD